MNLLGLESADGTCSIAWSDGQRAELRRSDEMRDSLNWLMRQLQQLQSAHFPDWGTLDGITCCTGPGGFTGVRVSVGYAQGLGLAVGLPVLGVSSLDALAEASRRLAPQAAERWVALDARMGELYAACYHLEGQDHPLRRQGDLRLVTPDALLPELGQEAALLGPGFEAWPDYFGTRSIPGLRLDAAAVLDAARQIPLASWPQAAALAPCYLRNNVARTLAERGKN